jgi:cellulose synthase/poly-beta-1,6-N-acetylglucosamine synthase-like glycosyltransferase
MCFAFSLLRVYCFFARREVYNMAITILGRIVIVCSALMSLYTIYFFIVALFGLRKYRQAPSAAPRKRFACVIAARNEEAVIGNLIDSLRAQNYPEDLYQIIAAPNNCTDNTQAIAQAHGARIFVPQGTIKSKGEVLSQVVEQIVLREGFDAMCVFDADNLADRNFLQRINDTLCTGAQAVQGFRDSKNPDQTAIAGCYSISYWMLNRFYNHARSALGLSALINGSGFAVSTALLRQMGGWHTVTMTEDYEFSAQCALAGERVAFAPKAVVYDEQPLTFAQSWLQRRRWTTGSLQGLQLYSARLFSEMFLRRSAICLDMFLTFLTPFMQLAGTILGALGLLLILLGQGVVVGGVLYRGLVIALGLSAVSALAGMLATSSVAALTVRMKNVSLRTMAKSIATFWVFALSHMVLTLLSFVHQERVWAPILHTNAKRSEDFTDIT